MENRETARLSKTYVRTIDQLRNLSPNEFEDTTAAMLDRLGFDVAKTPYVSDHGRDAIMYRGVDKVLLECKSYGGKTIFDRPPLQIFHSAMVSDTATAGFLVTTGRVTNVQSSLQD
jgi:HJR/Mrr/RecB family endonuclease